MAQQNRNKATSETLLAALAGGFAAIFGGLIFVGGLFALDAYGLRTLSAADGWLRPLTQLGGVVGSFGILGFALGPMVATFSKQNSR